jgi:hypothetical protein
MSFDTVDESHLSRLIERFRVPEEITSSVAEAANEQKAFGDFIGKTQDDIESLLMERYSISNLNPILARVVRAMYYRLRPVLPDSLRESIQRAYFSGWQEISFPAWPVDTTVEELLEMELVHIMHVLKLTVIPFIWFWPRDYDACAIVTHDVETTAGRDACTELMAVDASFGIRGSYQIIPEERYPVPSSFLESIRKQGCEIAVHDLNHDGRLFLDTEHFAERVQRVNRYGREFGAVGFRSGVLYRNQEWFKALDFEMDMSVPNTARLDAQRGGCCTVMPYFVGNLLELPLTTSQDYTLFHMLREHSPELWYQQIAMIRERHGLISVLTHPDYIMEERALAIYRELLQRLVALRDTENLWITTPGELNKWWRLRNGLALAQRNGEWCITGAGAEQACVAYASLSGETLTFGFEPLAAT